MLKQNKVNHSTKFHIHVNILAIMHRTEPKRQTGNIQILRYRRIETFAMKRKKLPHKRTLVQYVSFGQRSSERKVNICHNYPCKSGGKNENTVYKAYKMCSIKSNMFNKNHNVLLYLINY